MTVRQHSVVLNPKLCKGCVNCIKHCPNQAIRIRNGKARIIEDKCIDCGECVRNCPHHAQVVLTDNLSELFNNDINIAIVSPTLVAQFPVESDQEAIMQSFIDIGFSDVYDMGIAYEYVAQAKANYLLKADNKRRPLISAHCPVVNRLIQIKFPEIIRQMMPILPVIEVAAIQARAQAAKRFNVEPDKVAVWHISSCPAMVTYAGQSKGLINYVIAVSKVYGEVVRVLSKAVPTEKRYKASSYGVGSGIASGMTRSTGIGDALVVDGIEEVFDALEQISMNKIPDVDFMECSACARGCVGGVLNVANRLVGEKNVRKRSRALSRYEPADRAAIITKSLSQEKFDLNPINYESVPATTAMKLDKNILTAMKKLQEIEKILTELPGLDCGSCGAPSCQSLAEDIVQGNATSDDCVFKFRTRVDELAEGMLELSNKIKIED